MLKVYDLRRERLMRESRGDIMSNFWPLTYEDIVAVAQPDHPLNAAFRQTSTYWEMVYGFARHGIVEPGFWIESNGEGLFMLAKVAPYLDQIRRDFSPVSFANAEWISTSCEAARLRMNYFNGRVQAVLAKKRAASR